MAQQWRIRLQCRRPGFDRPGLGKSSGEGHGNPLQYSYLENPHGQRSLEGYSSWTPEESDMAERLTLSVFHSVTGKELLDLFCQTVHPLREGTSCVRFPAVFWYTVDVICSLTNPPLYKTVSCVPKESHVSPLQQRQGSHRSNITQGGGREESILISHNPQVWCLEEECQKPSP